MADPRLSPDDLKRQDDAYDALHAAFARYGGLGHDFNKHETFTSAIQGYLEAPEELREGYRAALGSLYAFSDIDLENLDSVIEGVADDIDSGEVDALPEDIAAQVAHDLEAEQAQTWAVLDARAEQERGEGQALQSETWTALKRQSAARKALEGEGKPKRKRKGFPFSDETVLYGEEQDPGALQEETYRSNILSLVQRLKGVGERTAQKEYKEDQRTMATPGYGRSLDNPFGKK